MTSAAIDVGLRDTAIDPAAFRAAANSAFVVTLSTATQVACVSLLLSEL
jgi:hypothetical protein